MSLVSAFVAVNSVAYVLGIFSPDIITFNGRSDFSTETTLNLYHHTHEIVKQNKFRPGQEGSTVLIQPGVATVYGGRFFCCLSHKQKYGIIR